MSTFIRKAVVGFIFGATICFILWVATVTSLGLALSFGITCAIIAVIPWQALIAYLGVFIGGAIVGAIIGVFFYLRFGWWGIIVGAVIGGIISVIKAAID